MQVGTIVGTILIGTISDKIKKRAIIICPTLFLAAFLLFLFQTALGTNIILYFAVSFAIGLTLIGCYNVLFTVIAVDLAS
jgi:sugar phosphate permease